MSEIVQKSWKDHRFVFNETSIIEQIVEERDVEEEIGIESRESRFN